MSALLKLAVALLMVGFLAGCWDRTELNDISLISAMAFDLADDNRIVATAQIVIPQNQGGNGMIGMGGIAGSGSGGSPDRATVRSASGITIMDALAKLQRVMPRKVFLGQCKVYIFSGELASAGIEQHFDMLNRSPQTRDRAFVYVSKGKAAELLQLVPPIERTSMDNLRTIATEWLGLKVTLIRLGAMLRSPARVALIPIARVFPKNKSDAKFFTIPYSTGNLVIKNGRSIGELSEKATTGLIWVRGEVQERTITFESDKVPGMVSLYPIKATVKLLPKIEGEEWSMTIKVRASGDIVQNGTSLNPMNPDLLALMNGAFEQEVRSRILFTLQEAQNRLHADIFNFAEAFYRKYPKQWEQSQGSWDELFSGLNVTLQVQTKISRPGLINAPGGIPKEEVKDK